MKKLFIAALLVCCAGVISAGDFMIDGKSQVQIIIPEKSAHPAVERELRLAARRLAGALKYAFGKNVPIVKESKAKKGLKNIHISSTAKARKLNLKLKKDYNYVITAGTNDLFITGFDGHRLNEPYSTHRTPQDAFYLGSVRGVVDFTRDHLKTRYLYPGECGVDYARVKRVKVSAGQHKSKPLPYLYATFAHPGGIDVCYEYALGWFGRGPAQIYGGHSIRVINKPKLVKEHPEYYAFIGGVRRTKGHNIHFCLTNPGVLDEYCKAIGQSFDSGVGIYQVGVDDSFQACQCTKCRTAFPNNRDYVWDFYRRVAERMAKTHPDKTLLIISYHESSMPPAKFKSFPPNVAIELTNASGENLKRWKGFKGVKFFTAYLYNWGFYLMPGFTPKRTPEYLVRQARIFRDCNIRGYYRCGHGYENFGMEGDLYYLHGRLLMDPEVNPDVVLDEFYRRAFHEAASPMKEFFALTHKQTSYFTRLQGENGSEFFTSSLLPGGDPSALILAMWSAPALRSMERYLSIAERRAVTPKVKKRLELVRIEFNYLKYLVNALRAYSAYLDTPCAEAFDLVDRAVTVRRKFLDSLCDKKGRVKPLPGWPEMIPFATAAPRFNAQFGAKRSVLEVNGRLSAVIGSPLTLDFSNYRKKKQLPDASRKSITARYVPKAPANDIRHPSWQKVKWAPIYALNKNARPRGWFKVLYDDKNLYVLTQTGIPADRKYKALGRHRAITRTDTAELWVDPTGTGAKYFHFMANPVANSYRDGAFGIIESPLDLRYNTYVDEWDGKWSYMTRRLHPVKSLPHHWWLTFVIPFKTLGVAKPEPGTVWNMDFGFSIFPKPNAHTSDLFLWSGPNSKFHDRTKFGELVFEK